MKGSSQPPVQHSSTRRRRIKGASLLVPAKRVREAKKIIEQNRTVAADANASIEDSIRNMLDWLKWMLSGDPWFRYSGSKEDRSEQRRVLNWLRRGAVLLRNLKTWPRGLEGFRADVERWSAGYESRVKAPARKTKPSANDKLLAAEAAVHLCDEFGVKLSATRTGTYCRLAAVLYGDKQADLQKHCLRVLRANYSTSLARSVLNRDNGTTETHWVERC